MSRLCCKVNPKFLCRNCDIEMCKNCPRYQEIVGTLKMPICTQCNSGMFFIDKPEMWSMVDTSKA